MNNNYKLISSYSHNEKQINQFHSFIGEVFPGISFKEWESKKLWPENYHPYSLIDSDKIISNACVALINVYVNGEQYKAAQIGAVGTLPEYRGKGLSRRLMEHIIGEYKSEVDFFLLFANETVLDFYPKFGFRKVEENIFTLEKPVLTSNYSVRKLNIDETADYNLIITILKKRKPITRLFGAEDYSFITLWHIFNFYKNNLFYLEEDETLVIMDEEENSLNIIEIINCKEIVLNEILPKLITNTEIEKTNFYFPNDVLNYDYSSSAKEDTNLFILGDDFELPELARFPLTAAT